MGIRMSCGNDYGGGSWRWDELEFGSSDFRRKLPLWRRGNRLIFRNNDVPWDVRAERVGIIGQARERRGMVPGFLWAVAGRFGDEPKRSGDGHNSGVAGRRV